MGVIDLDGLDGVLPGPPRAGVSARRTNPAERPRPAPPVLPAASSPGPPPPVVAIAAPVALPVAASPVALPPAPRPAAPAPVAPPPVASPVVPPPAALPPLGLTRAEWALVPEIESPPAGIGRWAIVVALSVVAALAAALWLLRSYRPEPPLSPPPVVAPLVRPPVEAPVGAPPIEAPPVAPEPPPLAPQPEPPAIQREWVFPASFSWAAPDPSGPAATVEALVAELRRCTGPIEVVGHTCDLGPEEANLVLSKARAEAVRRNLIQRGLPAEHLRATGVGSAEPSKDASQVGRKANRRVTIRCRIPGNLPAKE